MFYAEEMFIKIDSQNVFLIAMEKEKIFLDWRFNPPVLGYEIISPAKIQAHFTIIAGI